MPLKKTSNNNRVYFISNNADEDLTKIKEALITDNIFFMEKVYKSTINNNNNNSTTFINININIELDEETFIKICKKFNKILNKSYKMFYKDSKNKYIFIPDDIKDNINKSLLSSIED